MAALNHRADGRADLGGEARPVGLGDLVAERGAQPRGVLGGRDAVGVAEVAVGCPGGVADPQPAGIGAHLVAGTGGRAAAPSTGRPASGPDVASSSAALSRTERVSACSAAPPRGDVAVLGPERVAGPGRLEGEQAARRGRVAQRAAQVVAVRERHHARRHRGRRSAAGPAGGTAAVSHGLRVGPNSTGSQAGAMPELGRVGLAQDDQARPAQPHHELGVEGGHVAGQERASPR